MAMTKTATMMELFAAARLAGVPLLGIRTADPYATIELLLPEIKKLNDKDADSPIVQWDAARGVTGVNKLGVAALGAAEIKAAMTFGFDVAMCAIPRLPEKTIVFAHHVGRQLQSQEPLAVAGAVQAVANLRDQFKKDFRMLVCLGPDLVVPIELKNDFVIIDHPLPTEAELAKIVVELHKTSDVPKPTDATVALATDALCGLNHFAAETQTAMSLGEKGLNIPMLWERKNVTIEQTDGLSVYRGAETFDDLRGLDSVKARLRQHTKAKTPVGVAVWIDEGADVFQNVESDTSGVKTDQQRGLLIKMEERGWRGIIAVGVPGSGKSAIARAFGNEAGVPTIQVDFGAMESKWVGESESKFRTAIDVIDKIGRGHAFFILTANSLRGIRPQFQARFRRGVFFFDLPTADERDAIWRLYLDRYGVKDGPKNPRPNDAGWVGREIRECVESAWDCGISLEEAARYIVPVARSRAPEIDAMRMEANNRFLDASKPGPYQYNEEPMRAHVRAIVVQKTSGTVQ